MTRLLAALTRNPFVCLVVAVLLTAVAVLGWTYLAPGSLAGAGPGPTTGATAGPGASPEDEPSDSETTGATGTAGPAPDPEVGECRRLSYDAAVAPTAGSRSVSCDLPHTAETFAVGRLDTIVDGRLLAVDSDRVQEQVASGCPGRLAEYVGGTEEQRRLSMLRAVWFTPTVAQSDAGADWFRCDVVALAEDSRLLQIDGTLAGALDTEAGIQRYSLCATARPGAADFRRVACAENDAWRALRTVDLPAGAYPGEQAAARAGETPCLDAARAASPDPLDFQWGYEWPTAEQFDAGQTWGVCWVPTG